MIQQTKNNAYILLAIASFLGVVLLINKLCRNYLLYLGIIPRNIASLFGIFFAPLLHAHFDHLFFNLIPLLVFSNFILMQGIAYFILVTLMITIISGVLIWLFAKPGLYIGASAVITGYWGLLVCNIYNEGTITSVILGLISIYYFGGIFYGIFPQKEGVSAQGHLFGLIAGLLTSYLLW